MAMTMLQMAGASPAPATMGNGILLIIDAQREYTDGLLPLTGVAAAVDALAGLLDKARKAGAPVVHVRHKGSPTGKAFNPTLSGFEIVKQLTPRDGETIVDKGLPNAVAGTELAKHLGATGGKNLIVGGFMTHMCISATVRSATDNGFMSTVAADTVATRDLPDATGGPTLRRTRSTASRWRRCPIGLPGLFRRRRRSPDRRSSFTQEAGGRRSTPARR